MAVNINLKLNADDSGVKKKLADLAKMAKKGLTFGGKDGTPSSSGKPSEFSKFEKAMNRLSKAIEKETKEIEKQGKARYAWEKAKFVGGKVGRFAGAAAEGFHTGASLSGRMTSGHGEFTSGGFMNTAHDKISAAQDIYAKSKEGYGSIRDAYRGQEEKKDESGNVTQAARKGGIAAATVSAIPVFGGMIGAVMGGILNQVNDMGKEYASTMRTQQGTIGATGGFVGSAYKDKEGQLRGNSYFANSQIAQAQIGFNRTQSRFGNEGFNEKNAFKFAAQQNIGIAQYAEQLGQLKENDVSVSTDFLRGAADINRMTGLKQGQFVQKLAGYSNMLKEAGLGKGGIGGFAALTGGLAKAGNLTGERAFGVGQAIDQGVRKGFEGGAISTLIVGELAKTMKTSIPRAQAYLEEHGMADDKVRGAANKVSNRFMATERSQDVGATLFSQEGFMTKAEYYRMAENNKGGNMFNSAKITNGGAFSATGSDQLALENARQSVITRNGGIGHQSFKMSNKMGMDSLEMFEKLNKPGGVLEQAVKALGAIETQVFKDIKTGINTMNEYFKAFQDKTLMQQIGRDIKAGFMG